MSRNIPVCLNDNARPETASDLADLRVSGASLSPNLKSAV